MYADYVERAILALKQYYALPVFDPLNMHAVSDSIDPFWHAHILHTEQYMSFCNDAVGVYIHHEPLDHGQQQEIARVRFLYEYTREVMDRLFSSVDFEFYPRTLSQAALVCIHQDIRHHDSEDEQFILPLVPKAQRSFVHVA